VKLLAKNIRSEKMFASCTDLGFTFFQGSFFSEASKVQGRKMHSQQHVLLRIVSELFKDGQVPEIELRFKEAPELIVGLLRLVNSVGISGGRVQITTLRQALVALGQKQLLRWIMLLIYTEKGDAASAALIFKVILRARFMELLAQHPNFAYQGHVEQAHLVGMLSLTQDVVDVPLNVLLEEIGLALQLRSALLRYEGILGQILKLTVALEMADLAQVESVRHGLGISAQDITAVQLESIQWTNELLQKMS
jgi:EAL and modified HD-GYP domain-containing signal transduction protein